MNGLKKKVINLALSLAILGQMVATPISAIEHKQNINIMNLGAATTQQKTLSQEDYDKIVNAELTQKQFEDTYSKTRPDEMKLNICTLGSSKFYTPTGENGWNHNGSKLSVNLKQDKDGFLLDEDGNQILEDGAPIESDDLEGITDKTKSKIVYVYTDPLGKEVQAINKDIKYTYYKLTNEQFTEIKKKEKDSKNKKTRNELIEELIKKENLEGIDTLPSENGMISIEFKDEKTENKEEKYDGVYYFKDASTNALVSRPLAKSFLVGLPTNNIADVKVKVKGEDGSESKTYNAGTIWLKNVYIYPKDIKDKLPEIEKDVTQIGNDYNNFEIGEEFSWVIGSTVPSNIGDYEKYTIQDRIDKRLDIVEDSIKVYYSNKRTIQEIEAGGELSNELYEIKNASLDTGKDDIEKRTFEVDFKTRVEKTITNEDGTTVKENVENKKFIDELIKIKGESEDEFKFYVIFKTKMNGNAIVASYIPNIADIEFDNKPDGKAENTEKHSDINIVETGGAKFIKVDFNDMGGNDFKDKETLNDAVFALKDDAIPGTDKQIKWNEQLIAANAKVILDGGFALNKNGKEIVKVNDNGESLIDGKVVDINDKEALKKALNKVLKGKPIYMKSTTRDISQEEDGKTENGFLIIEGLQFTSYYGPDEYMHYDKNGQAVFTKTDDGNSIQAIEKIVPEGLKYIYTSQMAQGGIIGFSNKDLTGKTIIFDQTTHIISEASNGFPSGQYEVEEVQAKYKYVDAKNNDTVLGIGDEENKLENSHFLTKEEQAKNFKTLENIGDETNRHIFKNQDYFKYEGQDGHNENVNEKYIHGSMDGLFEIDNAYIDQVYRFEHKYQLEEVKAPSGYALSKSPIDFIVDEDNFIKEYRTVIRYDEGCDGVFAGDSNGKWNRIISNEHMYLREVLRNWEGKFIGNKKLTIPQTGGMGSILYILSGLLALGAAGFLYYRKNKM